MSDEVAALVVRLEARVNRYEKDLERARRKTNREMGAIDKRIKSSARGFDALKRSVVSYGAAAAAALSAREVVQYADAFKGLQNELRQVTESEAEVVAITEELFQVAQRSRGAIADTANTYKTLKQSTEELGLSQAELIRLTETIQKSAPGASGAVRQLGQALGSGALRGDELNSVLEGAPLIARAVAAEFGVTIGQLRDLAAQGEVTTERVVAALKTLGDQADANIAKTELTVSQALQSLDNAFTMFIGGADNSLGASARLASGIQLLAENLDTLGDALLVIGGLLTGRVAAGLTTSTAAWVLNANAVRAAALSYNLAGSGMAAMTLAASGSAAAMRGLSASMAFFGGPVRLAVVALAGGLAYLALRTSEAEKAAVEHKEAMQEVHDLNARLAASTGDVTTELTKERDALRENTRTQLENAKARLEALAAMEAAERMAGPGRAMTEQSRQRGYTTPAERLRKEIGRLEEKLAAANTPLADLRKPADLDKPGVEPLEVKADAAAKLRKEYELLSAEFNRFAKIARQRGLDPLQAFRKSADPVQAADEASRIDRAVAGADKGLEGETRKIEVRRIAIERLKDALGSLSAAEKNAANEAKRAGEASVDAWADSADELAKFYEEAQKATEAENERRAAASESLAAARAEIALRMEDQIRLTAAAARGKAAYEEETRAIQARDEARRIAAEAQKAGIAVDEAAIRQSLIGLANEREATQAALDLERQRLAVKERIAELEATGDEVSQRAAIEAKAAGAIEGLAGLSPDEVIERIREIGDTREAAMRALEREQEIKREIAALGEEASPDQIARVRELAAARHAAADAQRDNNDAMEDASDAAKKAKDAEEARRKATDDANKALADGLANAIAQADSFEDALKRIALIAAKGFFEGGFGVENAGQSGGQIGGIFAGLGKDILGGLFGGAPSFAGGGFTGSAARSGGIDGRGGFPAILHPRETVIDHMRPSQAQQQSPNVTLNPSFQIITRDPETRVRVQDSRQRQQTQAGGFVGGARRFT